MTSAGATADPSVPHRPELPDTKRTLVPGRLGLERLRSDESALVYPHRRGYEICSIRSWSSHDGQAYFQAGGSIQWH